MFNTTILILQLFATLLPSIGLLVFLLLHRRQSIDADLEHLRMRQEHGALMRLQATKRAEQMAAAVQACAPVLAAALQHLLAKRNEPRVTAADLSDEELVAEIQRRVEPSWPDECPDCPAANHHDEPVEPPIN